MLVAIKKYKFYMTKTEFNGFIIKLKKAEVIVSWWELSNVTELKLFL